MQGKSETERAVKLMRAIGVARGRIYAAWNTSFDLWVFTESFEFDGSMPAEAILATFDRRGTVLPILFLSGFGRHPEKLAQWRAFVKRGKLKSGGVNLPEVVAQLRDFLMPIVNIPGSGGAFVGQWLPKRGWKK